jgi:lipase chaperone LimK
MSAKKLYGKDVVLNIGVDDESRTSGSVAVRRFHESRKSLSTVEITDEEIEQLKHERRQRIAVEKARIMEQTPEEWQAAVDDFMTAWKGCLKGVPHMTAKEIRAERLERKYGQHGETE